MKTKLKRTVSHLHSDRLINIRDTITKMHNTNKTDSITFNLAWENVLYFTYSGGWSRYKQKDKSFSVSENIIPKMKLSFYKETHWFSSTEETIILKLFIPDSYDFGNSENFLSINGWPRITDKYGKDFTFKKTFTYNQLDEALNFINEMMIFISSVNTNPTHESYIYFSKEECENANGYYTKIYEINELKIKAANLANTFTHNVYNCVAVKHILNKEKITNLVEDEILRQPETYLQLSELIKTISDKKIELENLYEN